MKKRIAFSLALLMLLSLAACGGEAPVTPVLTPEPSPAPTEEPAVTPEPRDFLDWWDGDWYGWWIIGDGTGDYNELDDSWYDAAAHIEVQEDGIASLLLWDEDSDAENPIADVHLFITEEEQSKGLAFSTDGSFYGRSVDWTIDTAEARFESEYVEDLLRIEGTFSDAKGSFTYYIFLRPWGTLWDDVGENLQPHGYAAWYLPLLERGVNTAPAVLGTTEADLPEVTEEAVEETPVPETPVPETPVPETPVPATPVPATPVPATPVPATPVPETPVPETPVPETPVPATPVPATPVPETNGGDVIADLVVEEREP